MKTWAAAATWLALALLAQRCSGFAVCVFSDGPAGYASCTPGGPSSAASGYDVEVFRRTAGGMGWTEAEGSTASVMRISTATSVNSTYTFVCQPPSTDRQALLRGMATGKVPNATCAVAIGRVEQDGMLAYQGAKFSQPWLTAPIVILVDTGIEQPVDIWSWTKPFSGSVWAALCYNLVMVAVVLWLVERFQRPGVKWRVGVDELEHLRLNAYRTVLAMFNQDIMPVSTPTGQVVVVVYLFTVLILLATYTANLTANLTLGHDTAAIDDVRQLQIMKVLASADVVRSLNMNFQIKATAIDLNSDEAWKTVREGLANRTFDAFVGRRPDVEYYRNRYNVGCRLNYAGDLAGYRPAYFGPLFHTLVPQNIVTLFGARLWAQRDNSNVYKLQASELRLGNTTCAVKDPSVSAAEPVKLEQLLGLWIILGVAFMAALIQGGVMIFQYTRATMREAAAMGDKSMTLTRAMSTMIVKGAPEEDTELPPELRTHKIKSALQEMLLRRTSSNGSMRHGFTPSRHSSTSGHGSGGRGGGVNSLMRAAPTGPTSPAMKKTKSTGAVPGVSVDPPAGSATGWAPLILTAPDVQSPTVRMQTRMGDPALDAPGSNLRGVTFESGFAPAAVTADVVPPVAPSEGSGARDDETETQVQVFEDAPAAASDDQGSGNVTASPRSGPASPTLEGNLQEEEIIEL